jgi:hypothetical protein
MLHLELQRVALRDAEIRTGSPALIDDSDADFVSCPDNTDIVRGQSSLL